jgi:hypothetical protein
MPPVEVDDRRRRERVQSPPLADIAAAKIAAIIRPTRPIGILVVMKVGNT